MTVPNWGCFDPHGNYYVSDSGGWEAANGLIWVVRPDGTTAMFSEESVDFPNGMAVSPDGKALYVLESTPGRLVVIPIREDGTAGQRTVLVELPGAVPDGVALTEDGEFVISCYRPDAVLLWSAEEGLRTVAEDPRGTALAAPTNVAFTGPNLDVMVVPNIGRWHLTRIPAGIRGVPLHYPKLDGAS
jgi:gluconolactonase